MISPSQNPLQRESSTGKLMKGSQVLFERLEVASTMWRRVKGLLGRDFLKPDEALWIWDCDSIHTIGMKFPIDCVFLNQSLQVVSIRESVRPMRWVGIQWKATSVVEMPEFSVRRLQIQVGDQLHVGT